MAITTYKTYNKDIVASLSGAGFSQFQSVTSSLRWIPNILTVTSSISEWTPMSSPVTGLSGSFINSSQPFSFNTLFWYHTGSSLSATNYISLTAANPNNSYLIVLSSSSSTISSSFFPLKFKTNYINFTSDTGKVSAYWGNNTDTTYKAITNVDISWNYTGSPLLSAELGGSPYNWGDIVSPLNAGDMDLTANYATSALTNYLISMTVDDNLNDYRNEQSFIFTQNGLIKYSVERSELSATYTSYYDSGISTTFPAALSACWSVTPNDGTILLSSVHFPDYSSLIGTNGYGPAAAASSLDVMLLSSQDYLGTYTVTVSGSNGITYTNYLPYRPYQDIQTDNHVISAIATKTGTTAPLSYYTLYTVGISSNGTVHNLYDDQTMIWGNNSINTGVIAYDRWNTDIYPFLSTSIDKSQNINPLYLSIATSTTTTAPKLCSYSFSVSALSGSNALCRTSNVNFSAYEWPSIDILNSTFGINNEPDSINDIYRRSSGVDAITFPYTVTIRNSAIHPSNTDGTLKFTFGDGSVSSLNLHFSSFDHSIPNSTNYTIQSEMVDISVAAWTGLIFSIPGTTKTLHFVADFPQADFVIYPTNKWDIPTQTFIPVLCSTTLTPGPCAYGYCHTEVFTLSAAPKSGFNYYWTIDNIEPAPLGDIDNLADINITSSAYTSSHPVSLKMWNTYLPATMPNYHYRDDNGAYEAYFNYTNTSLASSALLKNPIKMVSFTGIISAGISLVNNIGISAQPVQLSVNVDSTTGFPVDIVYISDIQWTLDTAEWSKQYHQLTTPLLINMAVTEDGSNQESIKLYEPTQITVNMELSSSLSPTQSSVGDWCPGLLSIAADTTYLTAWPLKPVIYTTNKYVLTGELVDFHNLVPMAPYIDSFIWTDRGNTVSTNTNSSYTTSFNTVGFNSINLTTVYNINSSMYNESLDHDRIVYTGREFTQYNSNINRVYGVTPVKLPYRLDECLVPPNEWGTSENINSCFNRLNENYTYIDNMSKLYDPPPNEYFGWLGSLQETDKVRHHWRVNQQYISNNYDQSSLAVNGIFTDVKDCIIKDVANVGRNIMFVSNTTSVKVLSSDFNSTVISERTYKGVGDDFVDVRAIGLDVNFDNEHRIYILDSGRHRLLVFNIDFNTNKWKLLYDWGGLGGKNAKTKLNTPNDMFIDTDNNIWVTDTGNLCVKKFTRSGTWLATIFCEDFNNFSIPMSTTLDEDGNIYVLTTAGYCVFNSLYEYQKTIKILNDYTAEGLKTITKCADGGFFYICTPNRVIKISYAGIITGTIGAPYGGTYVNSYHDSHRNLLIANGKSIVKYIDKLDLLTLQINDVIPNWPMSDITIDSEEYMQDWVLNRSFARFWDNLEVFRRSLKGKFTYNEVNGVFYPVVRTFTIQEFVNFRNHKNNIYLGVNELVTADVINRCITKLYECEQTLIEMIT
jgi:hypothetical protein